MGTRHQELLRTGLRTALSHREDRHLFPARRCRQPGEQQPEDGKDPPLPGQLHPPVHRLWIELETIINNTVEKAMYGEPIDKVMKEARAEYERIVKSKTINEKPSNINEKKANETMNALSIPQATQPNQANWLIILVSFIAVVSLINAVLMSFILYK